MRYYQDDFSGGINQYQCSSQLTDQEYVLGINVRNRDSNLTPINAPLELDDISMPHGLFQGLYAIGEILLLFCSGKAYYKLGDPVVTWVRIPDFQMSRTAERIYGCIVPQSGNNYERAAVDDDDTTKGVTLKYSDQNILSQGCFVCQDGHQQPWAIYIDTTTLLPVARPLGTYATWTITNREYVPIGKQMMHFNGILFIVAQDGKSIYHSVSGRPLDFAVNIKADGSFGGNADTTSFAVDYNTITCIRAVNAEGFFVGTVYNVYMVTLDYTRTVFGEPVFSIQPLSDSGIINQYSIVEILGDYAFIDYQGIKSLNAVQQLKFKGRNSVFSLRVANLFHDIKQSDKCCAVTFDNYAFFSVSSTYGNVLVVYDTITQRYAGIDQTAASNAKQFAVVQTDNVQKLYAITVDNKLFEYYGSSSYATAVLKTKTWTIQSDAQYASVGIMQQKAGELTLVFDGGITGTVYATEFADDAYSTEGRREITITPIGLQFPMRFPITFETRTLNQKKFIFNGIQGYKIGYELSWNSGSALEAIEILASSSNKITPNQQQQLS